MARRYLKSGVALAALVTAALTLSACAGAAPEKGGKVTLEYETWYPDSATIQKAVKGFEAANPNIRVNARVLASTDFQKQLPLQLQSGQNLDVVGVQVSAMTNTVKDSLRPVDEWSKYLSSDWKSKLDSNLLAQTKSAASNKTLYSIPMGGVSEAFLYYNNEILSKAGVKPPTTLDELVSDVNKIKAADPSVTTPVAFYTDGWWQDAMLFTLADQIKPGSSDSILYKGGKWTDPTVVKALGAYKSLFTSGAVQPAMLDDKTGPEALLYGGKAAFVISGSWQASVLSAPFRKANDIKSSDWGAVPLPIVSDGGSPAARSFAEGGLAIPKSSKHQAEAARFIAYMTYGNGVDLWNQSLAYTPVAKIGWKPGSEILTTPAAVKGWETISSLAAKPTSNRDANQDFLNTVQGPAILDVARGSKSPQDAASSMETEWTSGRYPHATK